MKKSMSRVLSLALVLVMLLGVMPLALADGKDQTVSTETSADPIAVTATASITVAPTEYNVGDTVTLTASVAFSPADKIPGLSGWNWTGVEKNDLGQAFVTAADHEITVTATPVFNSVEGFNLAITPATVKVAAGTPALESITVTGKTTAKVNEAVQLTTVAAPTGADNTVTWTVDKAGATVSEAGVFMATAADTYVVTATSKKDATKSGTITITVAPNKYSLTPATTTYTMYPGQTGVTLPEVRLMDGTTDKGAATLTWTPGTGVTLSGSTITAGTTAGTYTIKGTMTHEGENLETVVTVNVVKPVIKCGYTSEVVGRPVTLNPTIEQTYTGNPTFTFVYSGDSNGSTVYSESTGLKTVKITAKVGDTVVSDTDVKVSFYNIGQTVEATMMDGYTAFTFDNANAIKGNTRLSVSLLRTTYQDAGAVLELSDPKDKYGNNVNVSKWDNTVAYGGVGDLVFSLVNSTPKYYRTAFTWMDAKHPELIYGKGVLTINFGDTLDPIVYHTTSNKNVTLQEKDLVSFWTKSGMKGTPNYVTFGARNTYGELYTKKPSITKVTTADKFYFSTNYRNMDELFYEPSNIISHYTDDIPFALYGGTNDQDVVYGVIQMKVGSTMNFRDVNPNDWFYEHVQYVYDKGIMNGVSSTLFGPQNTLTRGMVVTMLYRIEGEPRTFRSGTFTDVKSGTWYTDAVEWAAENNIVNGYGTTFGPNNNITRQDLAVILYRYAQYKKMNTYSASSLTRFNDYQRVASYATNAMEWAVYNKIMNGNDRNLLSPTGNATRAEAAKMFHVFLELK